MTAKERIMAYLQPILVASERVLDALVAGLELEFGRGAGEALAHRFLEAEEVDFHWEARVQERWIGAYENLGDDDLELDRVRVIGRLDGRWFVALMVVDGDGHAHRMIGERRFGRRADAFRAFADA
jgi:hypothetical protein